MSNQFLKLRRSAVPGRVPSTSSIDFGEIALNTFDGLAFIKRSGSMGEEVITLGSREGAFTGSFSGSFFGNGGGLFNIPASGIVGLNLSQIATGSITASVNTGTGSFSLVSGSSTFLFVSSSGNVGIGTASPAYSLDVAGNIRANAVAFGTTQSPVISGVNGSLYHDINSTTYNYIWRRSSELMRLTGTGNLLLNTTTDDTVNKLQVSGSAKITNGLVVTGSTTITNGLVVAADGATINGLLTINGNDIRLATSGRKIYYDASNDITITSAYGWRVRSWDYTVIDGSSATRGGLLVSIGNAGAKDGTAVLQADSTTKGFLLPRMTEAQRLAISSPARGLLVYDTGSVTEGLWYYNSGSNPGWQGVLTNSGSQTISGSITANNITVTGTLTAQTIVAQTITSSTDYVSGSTIFGNSLNNTHQFTGSVSITGSLSLPYLSTGSVLFAGATDNVTEDNTNFFWDNINKRLGIGTNAPPARLTIWDGDIFIRSDYSIRSGTALNSYPSVTNRLQIYNSSNGEMAITMYNTSWWLRHNANASIAGNLIVGATTDTGERLQVSGSSRFTGNMVISGSGNTSATNALAVLNSGPTNLFRVRNDGYIFFGTQDLYLFPTADGTNISTSGRGLVIATNATSQTGAGALKVLGNYTSALGSDYGVWISHTFSNGSGGTATHTGLLLNQTINQTGGASGITRGLYVNPTITSASDFRAVEWSNNAATAPSASWGLYGAGTAPNFLSGSLGIGIVPFSGSAAINSSVEIGSGNLVVASFTSIGRINIGGYGAIGSNYYLDSSPGNLRRKNGDFVSVMDMPTGGFRWHTSAVGAANSVISLTQLMVLNNAGNLGLGVTSPTAKLDVRGNTFVSGTLDILDAEINYQRNNNVTTGSARLIASIPTASLNAAFFDYVIVSGSNARAGTVTSVWVSSSVEWNETYTNDIGSTSDVTLYSAITGSSIGLFATSSINNVWTIKSLIRTI